MSTYTFGIGYLFGRRTDNGATPTPDYLGVLESFQLDMKQKLVSLMGQFKYAVDVAGGQQDITGKVKFARWQTNTLNDLLLGQTLTTGTGRQISVAVGGLPEQHAAAATVAVTNAGTFAEDLGVFYAATGVQLTRVAATPAVGSYAVNESTGTYTFNGAETGTLNFFYEYTVTTQIQVAVANTLMGTSPSFEIHYQHYYVANSGATNLLHIKFNACKGSDMSFPFKNDAYSTIDWGFQAYADASGNVFTFDGSE